MRNATVTVLIDNIQGNTSLTHEHGLSMFVSTDEGSLVWDTGQSPAFLDNARLLGIPVESTSAVVLSHGHYDHTSGIPALLDAVPGLSLHAHPALFTERFTPGNEYNSPRSIGIPFSEESIRDRTSSLILTADITPVLPGVYMTGEIPRLTNFEDTGGAFYLDRELAKKDLLPDDQSLVIDMDGGLVLLLGCCHSGLINTISYVADVFGTDKFLLVAGGMHLLNADNRRLSETVAALRSYSIGLLAPGHCTGEKAFGILRAAFPGSFTPLSSGWSWTGV